MTLPKPLQVFGWLLQLTGVGIVYIAFFTHIGPRYGPRFTVVYLLAAYVCIAIGRKVYMPQPTLLKPCPLCGQEIKLTNRICPYCKGDLHVTARFPGIDVK
jgi:hypothetical protein